MEWNLNNTNCFLIVHRKLMTDNTHVKDLHKKGNGLFWSINDATSSLKIVIFNSIPWTAPAVPDPNEAVLFCILLSACRFGSPRLGSLRTTSTLKKCNWISHKTEVLRGVTHHQRQLACSRPASVQNMATTSRQLGRLQALQHLQGKKNNHFRQLLDS